MHIQLGHLIQKLRETTIMEGWRGLYPPRLKPKISTPPMPAPLTKEQLAVFLPELPESVRQIVIFVLETGLTQREVFQLAWEYVDFERSQIEIERGAEIRTLPLSRCADELIDRRWVETSDTVDALVFGHKDGSTRVTIEKSLRNAGIRAGIGSVSFLRLRETFIGRLRRHGVSDTVIQALLGKSSSATTENQLTNAALGQVVAILNKTRMC